MAVARGGTAAPPAFSSNTARSIPGCKLCGRRTARSTPPVARVGASPAQARANFLRKADGSLKPLPAWGGAKLSEGETVVSFSNGGGGYGPPWERDPERVRKDVSEKWVSVQAAEEIYGVVLGEDGVDQPRTDALRGRLQSRAGDAPLRLSIESEVERLINDDVRPIVSAE